MSEETVIAESSPAPEPVEVEDLSDADYATWQKTGDLPAKEKPKAAAPAPAKKEHETEPPKTEAKASSTSETDEPEDASFGQGAQKRIKQLLARAKKAEEALASAAERAPKEIKTEPAKAESTAEELGKPKPPEKQAYPPRPKNKDFATQEEYEDKLFAWRDDCRGIDQRFVAETQAFKDATAQWEKTDAEIKANLTEGHKRVTEKYADGKQVISTVFQKLFDARNKVSQVTWFLNGTEVLPDLLYVMGSKDFKFDEFLKLGETSPAKAVRLLADMERDVLASLKGKTEKNEETASTETPKARKVTEAPPPPKEIGGKGSVAEDESEQLAKRATAGDDDAASQYIERENAKYRKRR